MYDLPAGHEQMDDPCLVLSRAVSWVMFLEWDPFFAQASLGVQKAILLRSYRLEQRGVSTIRAIRDHVTCGLQRLEVKFFKFSGHNLSSDLRSLRLELSLGYWGCCKVFHNAPDGPQPQKEATLHGS